MADTKTSAETLQATIAGAHMAGIDSTPANKKFPGYAFWGEKGTSTAGGTTITLPDDGDFIHITGTSWTCTDIDFTTAKDGRHVWLEFDAAGGVLTHNATTLNLLGGANITVAAGDRALFVQDSGDNVRMLAYSPAAERAASFPGAIIQTVRATPYTTNTTTTSVIPADDTIPQNTEGTQVLTATITPKLASSKIVAVACLNATPSGAGRTSVFAMFRDSVANAFAATETFSGDGVGIAVSLEGEFSFGDTSAHTITVRIGPGAAGTLAFNGLAAGRLLGGTMAMTLELREVKA